MDVERDDTEPPIVPLLVRLQLATAAALTVVVASGGTLGAVSPESLRQLLGV